MNLKEMEARWREELPTEANGCVRNRIQRIDNWVMNNFWKYHALTKLPLIVMVLMIVLLVE